MVRPLGKYRVDYIDPATGDRDKGQFTPEQIADYMAVGIKPPLCPFCKDSMVRLHIELPIGRQWLHVWMCDCETAKPYNDEIQRYDKALHKEAWTEADLEDV